MEVEQSSSNLKQKKSNVPLVNSNLCCCIADGEAVGLVSQSYVWHTSGGQRCAALVWLAWKSKDSSLSLWPKAILALR